MTISPHYRTVTDLLASRTFAIDEYQREYKWESRNIEELLADLLARFEASYVAGDAPKKAGAYGDYFLGSIIVTERNNKWYLVDGQQRVTSLTLLLIYLFRQALDRGDRVHATIQPLIYSDDFGEEKFNLDIPERLDVIRALFHGKSFSPDGKEESVQTIYARYRDIEEFDLAAELGHDGLSVFTYWLLRKVGLIEIAATSDAQAYSIFETMNDRGKPLSPVDMLKAYLLAPISDLTERAQANDTWKKTVHGLISWGTEQDPERDAAMVKAWFRAQYANSTRERKAASSDKDWELIGSSFHRWLRDNAARVGVGDATSNRTMMVEDFPFFANAYKRILDAQVTYTAGLEPLFYNAHNDFTWQSTVLLAPLVPTDDAETVDKKLAAVATYLDIWVMRRAVNYVRVGYSSVSYAMWLLARDIRRASLPDLVDLLEARLKDDDADFDGFPARGRKGVPALALNQASRRYIYHLLARVTAYTEVGGGRPDLFAQYVDRKRKNPADIEHITADMFATLGQAFPDEHAFQSWRNHVGGLLLLPADVNRSYQDKSFTQKAPHYAQQNLYAASLTPAAYDHQPQFAQFRSKTQLPFEPFTTFGQTEQAQRTQLLLDLCRLIWSPNRLEAYR